jgi:hypothetical protein
LIIVEAVGFVQLVYVSVQSYIGRFSLTPVQILSVVGYITALALVCYAELATFSPGLLGCADVEPSLCTLLPPLLWVLAVCVFVACVTSVLRAEMELLAQMQGYSLPVPLSRGPEGWMPIGEKVSLWLLLGRVSVTAPSQRRAAQLNAGSSLNTRGMDVKTGCYKALADNSVQANSASEMRIDDVGLTGEAPKVPTRTYSGDTNDSFADF